MRQVKTVPYISIIIITKNDKEIETTLDNLKNIDNPYEIEIIVVDGSEPKSTLKTVKDQNPETKWIYFDTSRYKKATYAEQRNAGFAASKGDIIVFIDCGCQPEKKWLTELIVTIESGSDIVASRIIPHNSSTAFTIPSVSEKVHPIPESPTNGLAVRKRVFETIGGFDERFTYGEDNDFTWRARIAKFTLLRNEDAIIYHNWGGTKSEIKRAIKYGAGRSMLYKKHPYLWRQILGYDANVMFYGGFILLLPLALICPVYPIILLLPFIKNIRNHPVRIVFTNLLYGIGVVYGLFKTGYAV